MSRPIVIIPSTLDPRKRLAIENAFARRPALFKLKVNAAGMVKVYDAKRFTARKASGW